MRKTIITRSNRPRRVPGTPPRSSSSSSDQTEDRRLQTEAKRTSIHQMPVLFCVLIRLLGCDGEGEGGVVTSLKGIDQGLGHDPESVPAPAYFPSRASSPPDHAQRSAAAKVPPFCPCVLRKRLFFSNAGPTPGMGRIFFER